MDRWEQRLKVLIADDHFVLRQILSGVLRTRKIATIDTASNGQIAREMIEGAEETGAPYDIVFLDWDMPLIEGIDLLKHFRGNVAFAGTAFVMLTAMSTQAQVLDAVKAGATAYLIKPISEGVLFKKLDEIIEWLRVRRKDD